MIYVTTIVLMYGIGTERGIITLSQFKKKTQVQYIQARLVQYIIRSQYIKETLREM